jgi:hypothetical protein
MTESGVGVESPCAEVSRTVESVFTFSGPFSHSPNHNNNNTFTWSGPSGVLDCTGQPPEGRLRIGASQCVG